MNSEELELSLRSEFENYLKSFRAEMREQAAELQKKVEAEVEKHRSQLDEAFQAYAARFDSEYAMDEGFKASVVEHLRQARDEGAALTAAATDEAKQLETTVAAAPADFSSIRDAVNAISQHRSQAAILKALVENASNFAPRGAFFIIKNEQLVGWQVFGADSHADATIRDIQFPVSSNSLLGNAVRSQSTADGAYGQHEDDAAFLEPLHFGHPDRMHAIPLTARGRAVAVLYADYGSGGISVNVEALEAIVRIAGLTVEVGASAKAESRPVAETSFEAAQPEVQEAQPEVHEAAAEEVHHVEAPAEVHEEGHEAAPVEVHETDFAFTESTPVEEVQEVESPFSQPVEAEVVSEVEVQAEEITAFEPAPSEGEVIFDANESLGGKTIETSPFDSAAEPEFAGVGMKQGEKAVEVSPANVGRVNARSARNVDLPIEVSDDERRPHNDARRFARLLVSEIKLYNEQRVNEGREAGDLYQRLREAIDRSREMYDKRVQPPVAEKFDYFHYELVNSLAEGNADRMGDGYPGSTV